jgi:SAM-dependent methyltransferase
MPNWEKLTFWLAYLFDRTPWDTNVTPPEVIETIEGPDKLNPGRAIDLGCGTGTNVIYLARHGWEAVGVDFVGRAIDEAREKAKEAEVEVTFFQGDVSRLDEIDGLDGQFDLALDIGCLHSLTPEQRTRYANHLPRWLRPAATYLLYTWGCEPDKDAERGLNKDDLEALFEPALQIERTERGSERGRPSAWYWLRLPTRD